jgi:hypothetical protein
MFRQTIVFVALSESQAPLAPHRELRHSFRGH